MRNQARITADVVVVRIVDTEFGESVAVLW